MAIQDDNLVDWDWGGKPEDEGRCCQFVQVFSCGCISKVTQNTPVFHQKTCMLFGHSNVDCSRMASNPRSILLGDACSTCSVKNEVIRLTEEHSSIEQATSDPSHVEAQGNDTPRLDIANMVIQDIKGCIGGGDTKAEVVEEGTVNNVEEIAKYQDVRKELNQVTAKVEDKEVEEKGTSSQSTPPVDVSARSFNFLGQEESDDKESFVTSSSMLTEADTDKVSCITALTTLSEIATKSTTQLASSLSPAATFRARMEAAALQGLQLNLNLNFKKKLEADKANKKLQVKTSQMDLLLNPSAKEWGSGQ